MTIYSSGKILALLQADIVHCDCYMSPEAIFWSYYSVTVGTAIENRLSRLKKTELIKTLFDELLF